MLAVSIAPSISAVIPAFDAEQTISDAIRSVLGQTHPLDEIIVVDDGSSDRTAEFATHFPGVLVIRRPNGGPGAARNTGIKAAKSEWIAFLDSDDVWIPRKTEIQIGCISPEAGVVHCNRFDPITFGALWHRQAHITPSSALVRKEVLLEVGGFEESRAVISVEDLNLWLKIATTKWKFVRSEPNLFVYRPTSDSLSASHLKMAHAELTSIDLIAKRVGCPHSESERIRQACKIEYARNLIAEKRWNEALTLLRDTEPGLACMLLSFASSVRFSRLARRSLVEWFQSQDADYRFTFCSGECSLSEEDRQLCIGASTRPHFCPRSEG
jgi:glycosyltransferase involved in cell wall biosynthesis